jgi:UPF0716 protein FxsA
MPLPLIILVVFICVQYIELVLIFKISAIISFPLTLLAIIATAMIGASLIRRQGLETLMQAKQKLEENNLPAQELIEGAVLIFAAGLLFTPGFVTDTLGFTILIPPIRKAFSRTLIHYGKNRFFTVDTFSTDTPNHDTNNKVIEGEYREL